MRFGHRPRAVLNTLTPAQVAELRAIGTADTHRKNATIYELGEPSDRVYLVLKGRVRLRDRDRDGRAITVAFAAQGEAFGLEALADISERVLYAVAAEKSEVLSVAVDRLKDLLVRDAALSREFLRHLAAVSTHADERIKMLAFLDVPSRLAGTLLWLADRYGIAANGGMEVPYWFTHQELADLIGSTRETVTTVLAEFRRADLIAIRNHHFVLRNPGGLRSQVGLPEFADGR